MFHTIVIVGIGLIGGSIGLTIKKNKLAQRVLGIDRSSSSLIKAISIGAIDQGDQDLSLIELADLVIMATPVMTTIELLPLIGRYARSGCIITDVGSTKQAVVECMDRCLPETLDWIGGHPMAGSEIVGLDGSYAELFDDAPLILTPADHTRPETKTVMSDFWSRLGMMVVEMKPVDHDQAVSVVSHLPHVVAVSLMTVAAQIEHLKPGTLSLSAGGFRDTTRIAAGSAVMWRDIFKTNRDNIIDMIVKTRAQLESIETMIRAGQYQELQQLLEQAGMQRRTLTGSPAKERVRNDEENH